MRYAVISDLHSNLEALQAVAREARQAGAEAFLCLGDVVGYGADPTALIAWVRRHCEVVIAGNHDWAAIGATDTSYFNPAAAAAARWTGAQLSPDEAAYLAGLPSTARLGDALLVHATPYQPTAWHYLLDLRSAAFNFSHFEEPLCFLGHSHVPGIFLFDEDRRRLRAEPGGVLELKPSQKPSRRAIVNVGSVGQPRDGNPEASYALYDTAEGRVELRRVAYDVAAAAQKILAAGLPAFLAERLAAGY